MTTILATRYGIFSDGAVNTEDGVYTAPKIFRINNQLIGCAGSGPMIEPFIKARNRRRWAKVPRDLSEDDSEFAALIVDKHGIWYVDSDFSRELMNEDVFAIGSGGMAAHAAYLASPSAIRGTHIGAERAVLIATQLDKDSAGAVQKLLLKES